MRNIDFYKTIRGNSPIEEFLDTLNDKAAEKVLWVMRLIKQSPIIPKQYFKLLTNTKGIFEIRVQNGNNIYRFLGFFNENSFVVLNGFTKKSQKTPRQEIKLAEDRKLDFLNRGKKE